MWLALCFFFLNEKGEEGWCLLREVGFGGGCGWRYSSSIGNPSGKFNLEGASLCWLTARSKASAASLAVSYLPRFVRLRSIVIVERALDVNVKVNLGTERQLYCV